MKIVLTGSGGYIGNFLTEYFSGLGIAVVGLDTVKHPFQKYRNFTWYFCDIRKEDKVKEIFQKENPTHVIHLAYLMNPQHNRAYETSVDLGGTISVFKAALAVYSVIQFIEFSSASVYGASENNPLWIGEEFKPDPSPWLYGENKLRCEEFIQESPRREELKVVIFRMCTACGPSYFKKGGLVHIINASPVWLLIDHNYINVQFIHEEDVKLLTDKVVHDSEVEGVFNLAPDSFSPVKELFPRKKLVLFLKKKTAERIFSFLWKLRLSSASPTSVNMLAHSIIISPDKIKKRYAYTFRYSVKEAVRDAVERKWKKTPPDGLEPPT